MTRRVGRRRGEVSGWRRPSYSIDLPDGMPRYLVARECFI
jgi:hypothetical protein